MRKIQNLIVAVILLFGTFAAQGQQKTADSLDLFAAPSDTTQTITQSGIYRITVRGADGGRKTFNSLTGGSGATVSASFSLQAGDSLNLVTGIAGGAAVNGGGGGGGSAVILTRGATQTLLIAAGGGGGAGSSNGLGGSSAQGTAGGGAAGGSSGGGGGFNSNGGNSQTAGGGAGTLAGGGAGSNGANDGGNGGYGFGGGSGAFSIAGGAGGGYQGGAGRNGGNGGNGGLSFVDASGTDAVRTDGATGSGNGQDGQNGSVGVNLLTPTAASVSIGGRVLTNTSRGLANAVVYLTDSNGETRIAKTNPFGYYRFAGIAVGQTVVVTIVSKRYQFAPQVLSVTEETTDFDFVTLTPLREL